MAQSEIKKCFYEYSCVLDSPFKDNNWQLCLKRRKYMNLINNVDQPEAKERLETYLLDSLCWPT